MIEVWKTENGNLSYTDPEKNLLDKTSQLKKHEKDVKKQFKIFKKHYNGRVHPNHIVAIMGNP